MNGESKVAVAGGGSAALKNNCKYEGGGALVIIF